MIRLYCSLLAAAFIYAVGVTEDAAASPPCRSCFAAPVVHAPVVHAPVVVEEVRVREVLVPILQPLPYFVDPRISYHYGQGAYVPAQVVQAPVVQSHVPAPVQQTSRNEDIDAFIDRVEKRIRERQQFQASEPEGPPAVPGFQKTSAVAASCAECHTGATAKGGFKIFESPGVWSPQFDPSAAWDAIVTGRMPPKTRPPVNHAILGAELGFNAAGR